MTTPRKHIVVIGAGVTGLQTAIALLRAGEGYDVTILAKHFPGDLSAEEYTSPWAGAHWRSHAGDGEEDAEQRAWDDSTYREWIGRVRKGEGGEIGLGICQTTSYSPIQSIPWFKDSVEAFSILPSPSHGPEILQAYTYRSIMLNVPKYLSHLLQTAIHLGARTYRATLPRSSNLAGTLLHAAETLRCSGRAIKPILAFVNATGISARFLVPDEDVYPIRGQTVTVRGEARGITTVDSFPSDSGPESLGMLYILPRPGSGTTILGGTKQAGDWDTRADERTTRAILERAREWAPELLNREGRFEVLSVQVGLRPGRVGGARVEIDELSTGEGERLVCCHAYGHAGAGYQNSVGSAEKVVRLFKEYFTMEGEKAKL